MLTKESDAKQIRCPATRLESDCRGRSCMGWRWLTRNTVYGAVITEGSLGYCGLAGKPNADELKESKCKPSE